MGLGFRGLRACSLKGLDAKLLYKNVLGFLCFGPGLTSLGSRNLTQASLVAAVRESSGNKGFGRLG